MSEDKTLSQSKKARLLIFSILVALLALWMLTSTLRAVGVGGSDAIGMIALSFFGFLAAATGVTNGVQGWADAVRAGNLTKGPPPDK